MSYIYICCIFFKVPTLSGIPRPLSHSIGRPPSRPSPSARVHALSKEDLDVDQNSEDDEEDDDEEEDDDDQGIQIEGYRLYIVKNSTL